MEVKFRTKRLQDCFRHSAVAQRELGQALGRKYIRRVGELMDAPNVPALQKLQALRCHPLKGERAGQWAVDLGRRHRLIFAVLDNRMEVIEIEEISKHYGD